MNISLPLNKINNSPEMNKNIFTFIQKIDDNINSTKINQKQDEIKSQIESLKKASNSAKEANLASKDLFNLIGNFQNVLLKIEEGQSTSDLNKEIENFLTEINANAKIRYNSIPMNNGVLNVHFMIFNKDYIMKLKNGYSSSELQLDDISNEKDIKKINEVLENSKKLVLEDWTISKKFESSINSINVKEDSKVLNYSGNIIDVFV